MPNARVPTLIVISFLLFAIDAAGQEAGGTAGSMILELGGAGEWTLPDGPFAGGATVAVEIEPVDGWLELELGINALVSGGHTELGADLLFKKPWRLSPMIELMAGVGPSYSRRLGGPERGDTLGIEGVIDLMVWQTKNVGWFVEPSYGVTFGERHERSLGATAGLLLRWR